MCLNLLDHIIGELRNRWFTIYYINIFIWTYKKTVHILKSLTKYILNLKEKMRHVVSLEFRTTYCNAFDETALEFNDLAKRVHI